MKAIRCPYLGMPDDPDTRLDFPSSGNVCHKADPSGPVKLEYQQNTCLTGQHVSCPVFTAAHAAPLPAGILAATPRIGPTRQFLPGKRLPLALAMVVLLGLALFSINSWLGASAQNGPGAENGGLDRNWTNLFSLPQTGANSRTSTPNPTDVQRRTACPMPDGWVTYTVNPTDSLYRLSVVHGISVEDLQRVNCLGNETVILPGQVIYLPFTPTMTPIATNTPAPFSPVSTQTSPPDNNLPPPGDEPTDAPPTQAPPTRAPTTAVTPTRAPTTAVPTATVQPTVQPTTILPSIVPTILPTLLPPILPTAAPTDTQEPLPTTDPGGGNNNRTQTINCDGGTVSVGGNNNDITFTGICLGLTVTGNNNNITVPFGTPVQDFGRNNNIVEG